MAQVVAALPDLSWNASGLLAWIANIVGYAVLILAAAIAVCAVIGIFFRGFSRLCDWVHEKRVHGWSRRPSIRKRRS